MYVRSELACYRHETTPDLPWQSFGKSLFNEGAASSKSQNHRINIGDLWWAWVDLNHRPRPYQDSVVRFYKNLQVPRGLPNTAQVIRDHSNCGLKISSRRSARPPPRGSPKLWPTVSCVVALRGVPPAARRRSRLALTLAEREDISRGIASGSSIREIVRRLDRAASTVSRKIARHICRMRCSLVPRKKLLSACGATPRLLGLKAELHLKGPR